MPVLANYYRPSSLAIPRYIAEKVVDKARSAIGSFMKRKASQIWRSGYGSKKFRGTRGGSGGVVTRARNAVRFYPKRRRTYRRRYRTRRYMRRRGVKTSVFRRRRRMRKYNAGAISLRTFAAGDRLPELAFGRCRFIGAPVGMDFDSLAMPENKTLAVNNIVRPFVFATTSDTQHSVRYYGLYNMLYRRYCVLGAKVKVRIVPSLFTVEPIGTVSLYGLDRIRTGDGGPSVYANYNPTGYWYIRIALVDGATGQVIEGHSVNNPDSTVQPWGHAADLMGDRTVAWSRDARVWHTGLKESMGEDNQLLVRERTLSTATGYRKGVTLTFKYSAKKQWRDKDILEAESGHWANINWVSGATGHIPNMRAYLRMGYVSFSGNTVHYRYPMQMPFFATTEIDYYCAFREPIEPHDLENNVTTLNAMRSRLEEQYIESNVREEDEMFSDEEEEETPDSNQLTPTVIN